LHEGSCENFAQEVDTTTLDTTTRLSVFFDGEKDGEENGAAEQEISLPSDEEILGALQVVKAHFCEVTGYSQNSFHRKEEDMGLARLRDALNMRQGNLEEAIELMTGVIDSVDRWPKRSGPVRWSLFATTGSFEKWARDANDRLDREGRRRVVMPKTQAEIDAQQIVRAAVRARRLCRIPADWKISQTMSEEIRIDRALEAHVSALPVSEALERLGDLKTEEAVRQIVGMSELPAVPEQEASW